MLRDLNYDPASLVIQDAPYHPYVLRVDDAIDFFRSIGQWDGVMHPWFDVFLPGDAVEDYVGIGTLKSFKVRFTKQTWPGETLVSSITITGKRKEDGENLVDLDVALANADGEVKVAGSASAALPSRG